MNNIMSIRIYEYKIIKNLTKDNKTLKSEIPIYQRHSYV